jgi:hypothetical protein
MSSDGDWPTRSWTGRFDEPNVSEPQTVGGSCEPAVGVQVRGAT